MQDEEGFLARPPAKTAEIEASKCRIDNPQPATDGKAATTGNPASSPSVGTWPGISLTLHGFTRRADRLMCR